MFCPVCGDEYQAGYTRCDDCDATLVENLPSQGEPGPFEMVTVLETGDQSLIAVARSLLESAGIPCIARNEVLQNLFGWGSIGAGFNAAIGPIRLQVLKEDEEVAKELLKDVPVYSSGIQAELVTPTGAAIAKTLATRFTAFPAMKILASGYGAGSRDFANHANVLRITVGEGQDIAKLAPEETIAILEANLDDLNPQVFGYVMDRALEEGALDAFGIPVQMKKNRPGMLLTVLARPEDADRLTKLLFTETTTLGVRVREEKRRALRRRSETVNTRWGAVRMKIATLNGSVSNYAPEYEDCRRIAIERQVPLKSVMQEAIRQYLSGTENGQHG